MTTNQNFLAILLLSGMNGNSGGFLGRSGDGCCEQNKCNDLIMVLWLLMQEKEIERIMKDHECCHHPREHKREENHHRVEHHHHHNDNKNNCKTCCLCEQKDNDCCVCPYERVIDRIGRLDRERCCCPPQERVIERIVDQKERCPCPCEIEVRRENHGCRPFPFRH
ncbi:MAG: hypothetical protein FWD89_02835 [Firmicutes bacterium]|nr:hypothetical protein [Bacillota bacterium]